MAVLDNYVQGYFISDGTAKTLNLQMGIDYMEVENYTQTKTPIASTGIKFRWQKGMASGYAFQDAYDAGPTAIKSTLLPSNGFTPFTQLQPVTSSSLLTGTAISNAAPPVCSSGGTGGLVNDNVVRLSNCVGATQFNGYEFTVASVVPNTTFALQYGPTIVAGTTFDYRYTTYNPQYYPRSRLITQVAAAADPTKTDVTMSVTHNLTPGQFVTFVVPAAFGMIQLNGVRARILAVNTTTNTITVDVNKSAFTPFAFPLTGVPIFTPAQVIPFGDGLDPTSPFQTSATLAGATQNTAINGMILAPGANGPAGQNNDVIYWRAWKASQLQTS